MTVTIEPDGREHEVDVTRRFAVTGAENIDGNEVVSVRLGWTHWPDEVDTGQEEVGPVLRVRVYGWVLNQDGSRRRTQHRPRELGLARSQYPQWLIDLIARFDDHGNPVS